MKTLLNKLIDFIYKKKHIKHDYKPLTNQGIIDGLKDGKLFVACLVSRNKDFVSKQITKFSGPFSHVVAIANTNKTRMDEDSFWRFCDKLSDYYGFVVCGYDCDYAVLASADSDGMNYFNISQYQNREMEIFQIDGTFPIYGEYSGRIINDATADSIIHEFLSEKVMNATYDYTGLVGQIFRKLGKWFYSLWDDERAYYCSEQAEIFKRHGVKIAAKDEPTPTEIYKYCKMHYPVVYSSLTREY